MGRKLANLVTSGSFLFLSLILGTSASLADTAPHPVAEAVRAIVDLFYTPFQNYPFTGEEGLCVDTEPFQVLLNAYARSPDGATAPVLERICLNRPSDGELTLHWEFGPTDEAKLLVLAGQNAEIVKSHDFWHVGIPSELMSSQKIQLNELVLERQGGIDLKSTDDSVRIDVSGISISMTFANSKVPGFLTQDIGISYFAVSSDDLFTAEVSAPLFNIPIGAVGDIGPHDQLSLDIFGFRFRIR